MKQYMLEYLETKITEHCNLRCSLCCNFGNIAKEEEYGLASYEMDFRRIKELGIQVKRIRLLGGESLLSKEICDYIRITRQYYSEAENHFVTNGILLKDMLDRLILRKNKFFMIWKSVL